MTERGPSIEERLLALGAELDEPPAPDLAAGVRSRLEREPGAAPAAPPAWRRAVAISLITLALGGGAAYAASAEVREAVRDLLGLGAVEVERAPELPPVTNHPGLDLGRPVEPASAPRAAGFVPLESSSALLRSPDAAFVRRLGDDGVISFVYRSGAGLRPLPTQASIGLVLTQVEADLDPAILKTVAPETPIEPVRVAGAAGYWIGGEHVVAFPPGGPAGVRRRTAASTLLWTRDGITLRLEAELSKRRALRLARTIR